MRNLPGEVTASSTNPLQAQRQEKKFHGVAWGMSFDRARELAAAEVRPILIDFTSMNCANCRLMEKRVMPRPEVAKLLEKFVTVQLYADCVPIKSITPEQREKLASDNQEYLLKLLGTASVPSFAILSPSGDLIAQMVGYHEGPAFAEFLTDALVRPPNAM